MLEKIKNIVSSLTLDSIIQGLLFLLLVLSFYWVIPSFTLVIAPISVLGFGAKKIYDLVTKNKIIV